MKDYILEGHSDVSGVVGTLPGKEPHITLKKNYVLVQHLPRSVPLQIKVAYEEELQWFCNEGINTPVQELTEWTNCILPDRKADGSLRLCFDLKDLNKNTERNQYYTGTIDDLSAYLHGSKYFMLMDVKSGYWMVQLNRESSLLTPFNTPWGSTDGYDYLSTYQSVLMSSGETKCSHQDGARGYRQSRWCISHRKWQNKP